MTRETCQTEHGEFHPEWFYCEPDPCAPGGGERAILIVDQQNGPYYDIQSAVDAASIGDIIELADGIYTGRANIGIRIEKRLEVKSQSRNPDHCIIDCEGDTVGLSFETLMADGSLLQGITITNGYAGSAG